MIKLIHYSLFILLIFPPLLCTRSKGGAGVARDYYVKPSGNDNNPGTETEPFGSIQKLNTLELHPGDKIHFMAGTYQGNLSLDAEGAAEKPILVEGIGEVIVDGGNGIAINMQGNHFRLINLSAKGSGRKDGNTRSGIILQDVQDASVENINTSGFQKSGIELRQCKRVQLLKVIAQDNGFCGIHITGTKDNRSKDILVKDCSAINNPGDPTELNNHSGNGILAGWSDHVTIDHCTATNNGWDMPWHGNGPVGIWAYESNSVTIQYCISYRNKTSDHAKDGGGFDLDGGVTHSVIQYCLSYENAGAGYGLFQYAGASLWNNNTVRYCISINDATTTAGSGGIFLWNGSNDSVELADCIVHNNLIYATHAPAIQFEPSSLNKHFSFYNNIFIGSGNIVNGPSSGEKFEGNVWWNATALATWRNYPSLQAWASAKNQEMNGSVLIGMQVDPQLRGPFQTDCIDPYRLNLLTAFTIAPHSTLKNTGQNFVSLPGQSPPAVDFFSNPVPKGNHPEPGVYEVNE